MRSRGCLPATKIAGSRVVADELFFQRRSHGFDQYLCAEAVADGHETEEVSGRAQLARARFVQAANVVAQIEPVQARQEFAEICIADALRRCLTTPERKVVEEAWKGTSAPTEIDANDVDIARRARTRRLHRFVRRCPELALEPNQRFLEPFDMVIAALRRVMPAVDEHDDDRVSLRDLRFDELERAIRLVWIPEPPFVIRLDEVQGILLSFDAGLLAGSIRLVSVRRATR